MGSRDQPWAGQEVTKQLDLGITEQRTQSLTRRANKLSRKAHKNQEAMQ